MIQLKINGLNVSVEKGTTLLEAAQFLGFPIPTLCHAEGLSPYGACRVCTVEITEDSKSRLVTSCTYLATEGLRVRTASSRVISARKMIIERLWSAPATLPPGT
jgi:NADH dehydrogenase/NADH:ubiquinone oxidoreductase subunit G